jgi:hypothetical protein
MDQEILAHDDQGPTVVVYRESDEEMQRREEEQKEQAIRAQEVAASING